MDTLGTKPMIFTLNRNMGMCEHSLDRVTEERHLKGYSTFRISRHVWWNERKIKARGGGKQQNT